MVRIAVRPGRGRRRLLLPVVIVGALLVAGVFLTPDDGGVHVSADRGSDRGAPAPAPLTAGAPDDGKASVGLPVVAQPATGLHEGDTVAVSGSSFTARIRVGIVMCKQSARHGGGVTHCDTSRVAYADVSDDGTFASELRIVRFIVTPDDGEVDCGIEPAACVIAAGNLSNYDESGAADIAFEPGPPPPAPSLEPAMTRPLHDGQVVDVRGEHYAAGQSVMLMQCVASATTPAYANPERCITVATATSGEDGAFTVPVRVWRFVSPPVTDGPRPAEVDCASTACTLDTMRSDGIRRASTRLTFDPADSTRAPRPSVRVSPLDGLHDGDQITIAGTGFSPSLSVGVGFCTDDASLCEFRSAELQPSRSGVIEAVLGVRVTLRPDGDTKTADCRRAQCFLIVTNPATGMEPIRVPLHFVRS